MSSEAHPGVTAKQDWPGVQVIAGSRDDVAVPNGSASVVPDVRLRIRRFRLRLREATRVAVEAGRDPDADPEIRALRRRLRAAQALADQLPAAPGQGAPARPGEQHPGSDEESDLPATAPVVDSPAPGADRASSSVYDAIRAARQKTQRALLASFALMVALPTLIGAVYLFVFAADQYWVEARFAVRGNTASQSTDVISLMTGAASSAANAADSYILSAYIGSREMIDVLQSKVPLRSLFAHADADWWARFPQEKPIEDFQLYWQDMVKAEFDPFTGIVKLGVRAFSAQDAQTVATLIVEESERLVNHLSEQARLDAVAFASREVQFAESRLRDARGAVAAYRSEQSTVDPTSSAATHEKLVAEKEALLSAAEGELAQVRAFVGPDAPSVRILNRRIEVLKAQIAEGRARVGSVPANAGMPGSKTSISGQLQAFEALQTEAEFAEKLYVSALSSLEHARADAKRDQRYLAIFVRPTLPEHAIYPARMTDTLVIFGSAFLFWAIAGLVYAAIKDHMV